MTATVETGKRVRRKQSSESKALDTITTTLLTLTARQRQRVLDYITEWVADPDVHEMPHVPEGLGLFDEVPLTSDRGAALSENLD